MANQTLKLEKKIMETIERHDLINRGDHIVVGVSGGPDSMCLLAFLVGIRDEYRLSLTAVHINHMLRPQAADEDQAYVEDYCRKNNIKCLVYTGDCRELANASGRSCEEVGRELRYASFDEAARLAAAEGSSNGGAASYSRLGNGGAAPDSRLGNDGAASDSRLGNDWAAAESSRVKIAVAHNANDQAETLLFRFVRGTGVDGLAGMEYSRQSKAGYSIIRPLLDCTRREIDGYISALGLNPCIDATNAEPVYTRNKLRLETLPHLEEFNPNIIQTLSRLALTAQEDKDYMWSEAQSVYELALIDSAPDEIALDLGMLQNSHLSLRHRVIELAFSNVGLTSDINRSHIEAADEVITRGKTGTSVDFPHGYILTVSYGRLLFHQAAVADEHEMNKILEGYRILSVDDTKVNIYSYEAPKVKHALKVTVTCPLRSIDIRLQLPDSLTGNMPKLQIRTRRDGDFIMLSAGTSGVFTKKLQDYFTDNKIPANMRDVVPLLCMGREVLLILGDEVTGLRSGIEKTRYTANYK